MDIIKKIEAEQLKPETPDSRPDFRPGDTVRVHQLIVEGNKERVQIFEGVVIAKKNGGINESFTVRKISYNVGVEKIFPLNSPRVTKIEIKQRGHTRRAKLYYLRDLRGKAAKIKQAKWKQLLGDEAAEQAAEVAPVAAE